MISRSKFIPQSRPLPANRPHLGKNAPSFPGLSDADMARSRRRGMISATRNFPQQISNNVTKPTPVLIEPKRQQNGLYLVKVTMPQMDRIGSVEANIRLKRSTGT
jgi:hypothetical protein